MLKFIYHNDFQLEPHNCSLYINISPCIFEENYFPRIPQLQTKNTNVLIEYPYYLKEFVLLRLYVELNKNKDLVKKRLCMCSL